MKRTSLLGFVGLFAIVLAGCPVFSGDQHGSTQTCFGDCSPGCTQPSDCQPNETCGPDYQCHSGDCTFYGCVAGYTCEVNLHTNIAACVPGSGVTGASGVGGAGGGTSVGGAGGAGVGGGKTTSTSSTTATSTSSTSTSSTSTTSSSSSGGTPVFCGHPADCPAGATCAPDGTCRADQCATTGCIFGYTCDTTCKAKTTNPCDKDADCASLGAGFLCIAGPKGGGVCTAPADQCFDQSQCDSGDKCVAGKCIRACTASTDCRDGFACDTSLGICSKPVQTCTVTNDCGSATKVCVGGACVPRSVNGTCSTPGDVWDENGCIPNQAATFTCTVEGAQDACALGSICLHHSCWISCDAPNQNVCTNQPTLNACKPVASGASAHNVCGTSQNLGGECDPTANKACTGGKVCIDGFCK